MTDEAREERNRRNRELLNLTPDNLDEHIQREQARELAVEQWRAIKEMPPPESKELSEEDVKRIDELMDEIIEISGCGGVFMLQAHEAPVIANFAAGRGLAPVNWLGEAIRHLMHVEEGVYIKGGPATFTVNLPEAPAETPRPKRAADGTTVQ